MTFVLLHFPCFTVISEALNYAMLFKAFPEFLNLFFAWLETIKKFTGGMTLPPLHLLRHQMRFFSEAFDYSTVSLIATELFTPACNLLTARALGAGALEAQAFQLKQGTG